MNLMCRRLGALVDTVAIADVVNSGNGSYGQTMDNLLTNWGEFPESLVSRINAIKALGFLRVGNGHYAIVLAHPEHPDVVFKVCANPIDSYHEFVQWCKGRDDKHLPKVLDPWDMHGGNVMWNPRTKAIVVTDPVC